VRSEKARPYWLSDDLDDYTDVARRLLDGMGAIPYDEARAAFAASRSWLGPEYELRTGPSDDVIAELLRSAAAASARSDFSCFLMNDAAAQDLKALSPDGGVPPSVARTTCADFGMSMDDHIRSLVAWRIGARLYAFPVHATDLQPVALQPSPLGKRERLRAALDLTAGLFDVEWHQEGRLSSANELATLGFTYGQIVCQALGARVGTPGTEGAQRRLRELSCAPLVEWIAGALGEEGEISYGESAVVRTLPYHWSHVVRVAGWLQREELTRPLADQLLLDELGVSELREIGGALKVHGDAAVPYVARLAGDRRLVWTRPASQQMPVAERALRVLNGMGTDKATKALRKALRWWNMRRFAPEQRQHMRESWRW